MVRFHDHVTGAERLAQDVDALLRLGVSAHEDVERSVIGFRPAMDGDVTLREHSDTRHAAIGREVMQVDVQERCARHLHASLERALDVLQIIEPSGAEQIHDEVGAGEPNAIALDEEVLPVFVPDLGTVFVRYMRSNTTMIFLLGGA